METPNRHHERKSLRLPGFDYSQPADYFVTFVTHQRQLLFGNVIDSQIVLSDLGEVVMRSIQNLPSRYPVIEMGPFVVMPNHVHLLVTINESGVEAVHEPPLPSIKSQTLQSQQTRRKMTLPLMIGYLKMNTAKGINQLRGTPGVVVWQRNYFEHVIRSQFEYQRVAAYIHNNPANWLDDDENNPALKSRPQHTI